MRKTFLLLILGLILGVFSEAQNNGTDFSIHFRNRTFIPAPNLQEFLASGARLTGSSFRDKYYRIIQFSRIPLQPEKDALKSAGIELLDYLPDQAYFASFRADFQADVLQNLQIRCILAVEPDYKLAPPLFEENYPAHALTGDGNIRLLVGSFTDQNPSDVEAALMEEGYHVTERDDFSHLFTLSAPVSRIVNLASLPYIVWIEPVSPEPQPENYTGRTLHHSNAIATDYDAGRHYDGTGVQLMLQDDGIIGPHIDYEGRIGAQYLTNNSGNHGDHCAGIFFGAGNLDQRARAHAFGATLWVYSVSPNYPGFNAIPTVYNTLGIRVTSASYGDGCNAGYNSLARKMDQQVRTYPALMHVFSAGNSGTDNCGYGAGPGWGNITGGHKVGKNVIAAANLDFQDNLASSSSRGPAHDGRIKPDISAKGTDVYSTVNPNTYAVKSGTSMASPAIAGTVAQLMQAYRLNYNGHDPAAGLLKACILNTAEDLGNPGPDFKFGWGRINALRAVQVIEQGRFDSGMITQGSSFSHTIAVPANTAQMRVMVYWTDPEAAVNTTLALVNNLNITLTDPASAIWHPWVLSTFPHADSLNKPAFRGIDDLNNMEQITIDNPAAGDYILNILGAQVPQGPQMYHVVYEFIPNAVILTYPAGGESFVPGETETIRWDANASNEQISLDWSADNGQTWTSIVSNLSGNARSYNWTVPSTLTGTGLLKVTRGGSVSQNAAPFSIMGVPCNLSIDWVCSDALHLSWSELPGAVSYEVFKLGEKYMEPIGTTTIPSFIVEDTTTIKSTWLSVRAIGANGAIGRRTVAVEKTPGAVNCYPADAMMAASPTAEWGVFQSCMDLNAVKVKVEIRNFGQLPVTNPTFHFRLDNGIIHNGSYNGTISPDSTLSYEFSDRIDISDTGTYMLKTWIAYTPDLNHANDTLEVPLKVVTGNSMQVGAEQTFDAWTKCLTASVCEAYSCTLENGWFNLENNLYDAHDWRTYSGSTPTSGTGPDFDHTTGNSTGKYLYVEPSVYCTNKLAAIAMPCLNLTGSINPKLILWYHAFGADIGSFHADLFDGSDVIQDITLPIEANQGNEWKKMEVDLTPWTGKVVGMRFRAITGCKDRGDFAIDDFSVTDVVSARDIMMNESDQLKIYPNPANGSFTIYLRNACAPEFSVRITDVLGKMVFEKLVTALGTGLEQEIDASGFPAGMYLVQLGSEQCSYQKKLIIK